MLRICAHIHLHTHTLVLIFDDVHVLPKGKVQAEMLCRRVLHNLQNGLLLAMQAAGQPRHLQPGRPGTTTGSCGWRSTGPRAWTSLWGTPPLWAPSGPGWRAGASRHFPAWLFSLHHCNSPGALSSCDITGRAVPAPQPSSMSLLLHVVCLRIVAGGAV